MNVWRLQKPQSKNSAKEVSLATTQCLSRFLWLNQVCRKGLSDSPALNTLLCCCDTAWKNCFWIYGLVSSEGFECFAMRHIWHILHIYMFVVFMWSCEILGLVALNLFGLHSFCWPQYFSCRGAFFAWRAPILSEPRIMCSQVRMLTFLEPSREMP